MPGSAGVLDLRTRVSCARSAVPSSSAATGIRQPVGSSPYRAPPSRRSSRPTSGYDRARPPPRAGLWLHGGGLDGGGRTRRIRGGLLLDDRFVSDRPMVHREAIVDDCGL